MNPIDALIDKIEGKSKPLVYEESIQILAANFMNTVKMNKKVLFTGNTSEATMEKLCTDFCEVCTDVVRVDEFAHTSEKIEVCFSASINSSAKGLKNMNNADAVVLIEEKKVSLFSEIDKTVVLLNDAGKDILGFVLV